MIVWTKVVAVEINIIYMIEVIEEIFDEKGQGSQIFNKKLIKEGIVVSELLLRLLWWNPMKRTI